MSEASAPAADDLCRRLLRLLEIMKSSKRTGMPMAVWAEDIKAVEEAAADVAMLDQVTNQIKPKFSRSNPHV